MCVVMSGFEGNTRDYIDIPSSYEIQTNFDFSFPIISDSKLSPSTQSLVSFGTKFLWDIK